jgi:hypothetical protein
VIDFTDYIKELKAHKPEEITEHSLRPELKGLLQKHVKGIDPKINILHEPKRLADYGAPDFRVTLNTKKEVDI